MGSRRTHPRLHLKQLQPLVQLREEFGRSSERNGADASQAVVERLVLGDPFSEWSTLEVDDEGGDLLAETKQVDGGVQQGWSVFRLDVDDASAALEAELAGTLLAGPGWCAYSWFALARLVM